MADPTSLKSLLLGLLQLLSQMDRGNSSRMGCGDGVQSFEPRGSLMQCLPMGGKLGSVGSNALSGTYTVSMIYAVLYKLLTVLRWTLWLIFSAPPLRLMKSVRSGMIFTESLIASGAGGTVMIAETRIWTLGASLHMVVYTTHVYMFKPPAHFSC